MPGIFICYEPVTESAARVTSTTTVGDDAAYSAQLTEQGVLFKYVPLDGAMSYVKIDGDHIDFVMRPRIEGNWTKNELAPIEVTTLPDVPAGEIQLNGPVNGYYQHKGGDMHLSFVLPGLYQVYINAFPYMLRQDTFNVVMPKPGAASNV